MSVKNKQDLLRRLILKDLIVFEGSSMEPLLHSKDSLHFEKITFNRVKINDLLLISSNNDQFVHRVIYKTSRYLISKGDNNLASDNKIYPTQIIGKLVFFIRNNHKIYIEDLYLFQSTAYLKEIIKINALFVKNKIDFLFLKGLILHLYLIKTHPKRLYNDCDILVNKKSFKKVDRILIKLGYKRQDDALSNQNYSDSNIPSAASYIRSVNNFPVIFDIHSELVFLMTQIQDVSPLFPKEKILQMSNDFLKQKKIIKIASNKFPVLSENNMVIYLALHFFHHNFRGVFRLEFLHTFITNNKLNNSSWTDIMTIIRFNNISNYVFPVFVSLKRYFQTPIPVNFMDREKTPYLKIFDDQNRGEAGIERFLNIFNFSNEPFYKKILIIFNRQFMFFTFLILKVKLSSFLKNQQ